MSIGERIKKQRLLKQLTLEELAESIHSTRQTIHRYETGEISNIPSDKIESIAKTLNVTPSFIMGWEEDSNIYGNHADNLEYFADKPELLEIYKEIHDSESLQLLFDNAKDLEPQDLETVLMIIKGIKAERNSN